MNIIKKYNFIYKFLIFIIIATTILTIFNMLIPLNKITNQIISLIPIIMYSFIISYNKGKVCEEKAYKEGFKLGLFYIITLTVLSIITFNFSFKVKRILYYLIILFATTLGSIVGIQKKSK